MPKKPRDEIIRAISFASDIAITIAACVLIGVLLGRALDSLFGSSPWLLLVFSLLGVGAGINEIYRRSS